MDAVSFRRAGSAAMALAAVCGTAGPADAQMDTYRHPIGLAFSYPSGWELQETEIGVAVLPADGPRDALGQPMELIVVNARETPDVTVPDDPRIVSFFAEAAAPLRRVGGTDVAQSGLGPGALLTFEGSAGGEPVRQRIYVTVHEGTSVYVLHVARDDLRDTREETARAVFESLRWDRGSDAPAISPPPEAAGAPTTRAVDERLVRTWSRSSTSGSTGGGGSVYATDRETIVFGGDGALVYAVGTVVSADVPNLSAFGRGDPNVEHGRWRIDEGMLVVEWETGGVDRFEYSVFVHTDGLPALKLQAPGGDPVYYR